MSKNTLQLSRLQSVGVVLALGMLAVLTTTSVMTAVAAQGTENRIGDLADRLIATQTFEGLTEAAAAEKVMVPALREIVAAAFDLYVHAKAMHGQETLDRIVMQMAQAANNTASLTSHAVKFEHKLEGAVSGIAQSAAASVARALEDGT